MTVSRHGIEGRRSSPQVKASSTTILLGIPRALSRRSNDRSPRALGLIGAMNAIAVELPRGYIAQVTVPDILGAFRQRDPLDLAPTMAIEEAEFDLFGVRRKQREVCSASVPNRSQRMRRAGRNRHATAPEREKLQRGAEQQG